MHGAHVLVELVVVLGTAAVTTLLFQALRQPVVLGYILAGVLIGPHVPVPLVASPELVGTLSELGVILLMFSIGLEFSIRTIARVGLGAGLTAAVEVAMMVSLGYLVGLALGWTGTEALFLGACLGISSTMLVAKAFEDRSPGADLTQVVFAILVFEDLLAIVLLAVLTAVAGGSGLAFGELASLIGRLVGFLALILVAGLLVVPRAMRTIVATGRSETLLIACLAVCFGMAVLAAEAGFSVALGAFVGGMLVAESGKGHEVDEVIRPFRDVFAAVFFVSVGMSIDPAVLPENWLAIVICSVVVVAGKAIGVTLGAFFAGQALPRAVRAGLSLTQIGEFSFIIAGLGTAAGVVGPQLMPIAVAVSCLTAFATPLLIGASERVANWTDAHLPRRLQTFVTFYGSWIERLRTTPRRETLWARLRLPLVVLLLDAALLVTVVIAEAVASPRLAPRLADRLELDVRVAEIGFAVGAVFLGGLFLLGVIRNVRRLARLLAAEVIPHGDGGLDLGTAPRRALFVSLELLIVLVVGLPMAAIIQPFVPAGGAVLVLLVLVLSFAAWRATTNLHGHVRAGAELIVEALARRTARAPTEGDHADAEDHRLDDVSAMLPGFAGLAPVTLAEHSPAVGRTLADLNLRALTGATVLAITRDGGGAAYPSAGVTLRAGDVLAVAGSDEAVAAARTLLTRGASDRLE